MFKITIYTVAVTLALTLICTASNVIVNNDFGLPGQIPFVQSDTSDFDYSNTFTYEVPANNFKAAKSYTQTGTGIFDNNFTFGESSQRIGGVGNIRWSVILGEKGILDNQGAAGKRLHNASIIGAFDNKIRMSGGESFSCAIFSSNLGLIDAVTRNTTSSIIAGGRNGTITDASCAFVSGYHPRVTQHGGYVNGYFTTYNGMSGHSGLIQDVLVSGLHGFNHSANSPASLPGEGVRADWGAALGGMDHDIPPTSAGAVAIGGTQKIRANAPGHVQGNAFDASDGDVIVMKNGYGIIQQSPNGHYWRQQIDNCGHASWIDIGTTL